ncbi:CopG family transcriptional regulator [Phenylobacterium sp. SCN 70-31]|uniref:CopG family transcriptional regulator n=1 Tax=Phenylobacterium sp. SCN 70-31 TaxID=1660129 RepID=UPI00086D3D19|nr:CopG family transcriptional regulator [Phenylobacterium sp. SCN 70-31]ODT89787.1 MAG: CopG family transcriptional regulator [Phenylobacterium sp. SCN 70-31]
MSKPGPGFEEQPSVFDVADAEADEASALRGQADFAAGRVISHEAMKRWLLSWGASDELPPPKCGE